MIQTRQHLAVLVPSGPVLVLNLLRWGDEIRTWDDLDLPEEDTKAVGLTEKEIKMGEQLVNDMSGDWNPEQFTDSFKEQIQHLVEEKVNAGETETITKIEDAEPGESANIYDLTELLQRSLKGAKPSKTSVEEVRKKSALKPLTQVKTVKKTAVKTGAKKGTSKVSSKAG